MGLSPDAGIAAATARITSALLCHTPPGPCSMMITSGSLVSPSAGAGVSGCVMRISGRSSRCDTPLSPSSAVVPALSRADDRGRFPGSSHGQPHGDPALLRRVRRRRRNRCWPVAVCSYKDGNEGDKEIHRLAEQPPAGWGLGGRCVFFLTRDSGPLNKEVTGDDGEEEFHHEIGCMLRRVFRKSRILKNRVSALREAKIPYLYCSDSPECPSPVFRCSFVEQRGFRRIRPYGRSCMPAAFYLFVCRTRIGCPHTAVRDRPEEAPDFLACG